VGWLGTGFAGTILVHGGVLEWLRYENFKDEAREGKEKWRGNWGRDESRISTGLAAKFVVLFRIISSICGEVPRAGAAAENLGAEDFGL
jgi:hypothetical protein